MFVSYRSLVPRIIGAIGLAFLIVATARSQSQSTPVISNSPRRADHIATQEIAKAESRAAPRKKIAFALDQLDTDGLRGPTDGKVAVSYEFGIPDTKRCRDEVKRIDPTVRFMPGSSGRIGVRKGQCLCVGTTHQSHWRSLLDRLAALPYVQRIAEDYFE